MSEAKIGNKVKIHYTGKLGNGDIFDTTRQGKPLELTIGGNQVFPALEKGIVGMAAGESKTIALDPEQAFGARRDELIVEVDRKILPESITPEIGMELKNKQPDGKLINVRITEINGDKLTLDANHPLAGQSMVLDIEMVEIG
ncbi:MAG: peptidylprolyl isomerase [candidate division Zixibacteria bacterium]|nr:peptidylprolyl isomerase [candidate division Zixibacteria bacterium]